MSALAKVVADSISPSDKRITTMQLMYPRFIHAEFMTHRVFSRNASSSRAIPVAKMIEQVRTNPAMPIHWGKNQPGMQANEQLTGQALENAQDGWTRAAWLASNIAEEMMTAGCHKQVVNRILEPFQFIHVVVTATEWDNFFELRAHKDAQPEIQALAVAMREAMDASVPARLGYGQWHLPYVRDSEIGVYDIDTLRKISSARCARVSYLTHDGKKPDIDRDIELYERLVGSRPIHASPTEHQAMPAVEADARYSGNFQGWVQHRKLIETTFGV